MKILFIYGENGILINFNGIGNKVDYPETSINLYGTLIRLHQPLNRILYKGKEY